LSMVPVSIVAGADDCGASVASLVFIDTSFGLQAVRLSSMAQVMIKR